MIFSIIDIIVAGLAEVLMLFYFDEHSHLHTGVKIGTFVLSLLLTSILIVFASYLKLVTNLAILLAFICTTLLLRAKLKIAESRDK